MLELLPKALQLLAHPADAAHAMSEGQVLRQRLQQALRGTIEGGVLVASFSAPLQQLLWLLDLPAASVGEVCSWSARCRALSGGSCEHGVGSKGS